MTVVWMNDAAMQSLIGRARGFEPGMPVEEMASVAGTHDIPAALREAADAGEPRHVSVDLVSTGRGSVTIGTSVYPLPGGMLLVLTENSWEMRRDPPGDEVHGRASRRRR